MMLIQDGRLRPLAEPWRGAQNVIGGVILLPVLLFLCMLMKPRSRAPRDLPPITPVGWVEWLASQGFGTSRAQDSSQTGPAQDVPSRLEYLDAQRAVVVIGVIFIIGLMTMWVDADLRGLPISLALLPDGHSILPSLLIMGVAAVLAYYLPHRLRSEFNKQGLLTYRSGSQEPAKVWSLRRWVPPFDLVDAEGQFDDVITEWVDHVNRRLQLTAKEARGSAALALILVLLDAWAGLPVPFGFSWGFLLIFEFFLLWIIIAAGWTMSKMAGTPTELERYLSRTEIREQAPSATGPVVLANVVAIVRPGMATRADQGRFEMGHLDLMSISRIGTIFIETIAYLLAVFGLLLVARLSAFGMARWRWNLYGFPLWMILAAIALVFILGFWLQCYSTLQRLIRGIKRDRLEELDKLRSKALEGKGSEEQVKASEEFEKQRRSIEQVSEQPWGPSESRRAWIALFLALLPPVLTSFLSQGSDSVMRFLRSLGG
jgi:hypothetical protein